MASDDRESERVFAEHEWAGRCSTADKKERPEGASHSDSRPGLAQECPHMCVRTAHTWMCPHAPQRPPRHVVQMKGVCQGPRLPQAASVLANKMLPGFQAVQECAGFSKNELRVICEEGRLPRKASRAEQVAVKRKVAQPVPRAVRCSPKQLDVYRAVDVLRVTSSLPKGTPGAFRQPGALLLTDTTEIVLRTPPRSNPDSSRAARGERGDP